MPGLDNYRALLERIDDLCARTVQQFSGDISCHAGCDACCRHLSVFAVEAAALRAALRNRPSEEADLIRRLAATAPSGRCPLLHDGLCLLYEARPVICRTHGLPLMLGSEGEKRIDFCPENFKGVSSIPGSAIIDLERLNTMLAAVNALYLQQFPGPERFTIARALALAD